MFKKLFLSILVIAVLAGGGTLAWFKLMRPVDPFGAAKVAMEKGDFRAAQIELRNTVRNDPNNAEAHFRLGLVQLRLGDPVAAERGLRLARDNGFDPRLITPLLAQTYLAQGKFKELLRDFPTEGLPAEQLGGMLVMRGLSHMQIGELDPALQAFIAAEKAAPQSLDPVLSAARVQVAKNDFQGAEVRVDRALTLNAQSPDALLLKAQLLNQRGDRRTALSTLDSAITQAPKMIAARLERANLLVALAEDDKAKEDVDESLKIDPRSAGATYLKAVLAARARDYATAEIELNKIQPILARLPRGLYFQAVVKFNLGQGEQAADAATKFVARNPTDVDGIKLLARISLSGQRAGEAIELLKKAMADGVPADPDLLDLLARSYAQTGNQQLALATYERAVALAPDNADLLARQASIRLGLGDAGGAARDLEQSLELAPQRADANEALVVAALTNGETERAAAALVKLKQSGPRTENMAILEGMVRTGELNFEAARTAFTNALRDYPGSVRARLNLARLAIIDGRTADAEQFLGEILKQEPANEQALSALVNILVSDGRTARAIVLAEAGRAAAPTNNALTAALADLYLRGNEARKSLELVEAAQRDQPPLPILIVARARAQVALGMLREAQEGFRAMLATNPGDAGARRALVDVLLRDNSPAAAKALLRDGLTTTPGQSALLQTLVAIDLREGNIDTALATLTELQQDPRNLAASRSLRGDIYATFRRYNEAAQAYFDDFRAVPGPELLTRTAAALNDAGRTDEARALLQDWLARTPDDVNSAMVLVTMELAAKRYPQAEAVLLQILAKDPRNVVAMNNLAWLYQQKGDPQARALAQKAYLLGPSPHVADTLGWILTSQGEAALALPLLRQAAVALPTEPAVQYHYAVALNETGKRDEAAVILRAVIATTATFDERPDATRLLETLNRR